MPQWKRNTFSCRTRDRSALIASIFKSGEKDASYISNSPELLKQHIKFIYDSAYANNSLICKLVVPAGQSKGLSPKRFDHFKKYYPYIYERWVHMIRSCLDPSYYYYQFFGGKGIYVSRDFLDSKLFCIWCLKNGLTSKLGMYDKYIQRKRKNRNYSPGNCYVITEKELHECKSLKLVLGSLYITKKYEEGHDESVSYMTMYTRYYAYDLSLDDALYHKYDTTSMQTCVMSMGFSPTYFYRSVATENDVSLSVFLSRYHYSYLNGGFTARPYDMLKEDFSIEAETARQGKISYKKQWERNRKEQLDKQNAQFTPIQSTNNKSNLTDDYNGVYSNSPSVNVYD